MSDDHHHIEELHRRDEEAAKKQDLSALNELLSEDAVFLPPGGNLSRGRPSADENGHQETRPATEILDYRFDWRELKILGDYAFEWGYILGKERDLDSGEITTERYHVMRILQKQPDGEWKVHRSIWNEAAGI